MKERPSNDFVLRGDDELSMQSRKSSSGVDSPKEPDDKAPIKELPKANTPVVVKTEFQKTTKFQMFAGRRPDNLPTFGSHAN